MIKQLPLPQFLTEEKLLDQDKDYVKDFVFELYRKSLCPEETLLDWLEK